MSVKNNSLLAAVYLALGVTAPAVAASPVLETLLNDYTVTGLDVVQVDDSGRSIVMASVRIGNATTSELRPVSNVTGDVKLFSDMGAVYPLIKRSKMIDSTSINFVRKEKALTVGDPISTLKAQFKAFKAEKLIAEKSKLAIDARITAAIGLGWDLAVGTGEAYEYADYLARRASVNEAIAYVSARVTALAASLTAAGIDPVTVV